MTPVKDAHNTRVKFFGITKAKNEVCFYLQEIKISKKKLLYIYRITTPFKTLVMKKIFLGLIALLFSILFVSAQNTNKADDIIGIWLSKKKNGKVEVYKTGNKYFGKLIRSKSMFEADGTTSKKDLKNLDASLRTRKLKDLIFPKDFVFEDNV